MKLQLTAEELMSGLEKIDEAISNYYVDTKDDKRKIALLEAFRHEKEQGTRIIAAVIQVERKISVGGKTGIQRALHLNALKGSDGKELLAAVFTSKEQAAKGAERGFKSATAILPISDVTRMFLGSKNMTGLLINPFDDHRVRLSRTAVEAMDKVGQAVKERNEENAKRAAAGQQAAQRAMDRIRTVAVSGVLGAVVGDALGVPAEFMSREELAADPITDMTEFGSHKQPKGTWSDDSSMILAELDSFNNNDKLDFADVMENFFQWYMYAKYTPAEKVFDSGNTCATAIMRYSASTPALECGLSDEDSNGNGSLMRILPFSLLLLRRGHTFDASDRNMLHQASALTHAHARSKLGCEIYSLIVRSVFLSMGVKNKADAVQEAINDIDLFYRGKLALAEEENETAEERALDEEAMDNHREFVKDYDDVRAELPAYERLLNIKEFAALPESEIESSGYVVDTLEAALWCFLTTESYRDCVLKAVNLGDDTDTVACVAGGLAGIYYGSDSIPEEWKNSLIRREWIEDVVTTFQKKWIG